MRRAQQLGIAILAPTIALALTASATGVAHASPRRDAGKQCVSTSSSGTTASRYNRTPRGHGPWRVPLDPCNTEATGLSATPYDNCAYWAAEKRPDVWVDAVWKYGYRVAPGGAWNIKLDAARAHLPISHHPEPGDLAAWSPNATMGHTASGVTFTASPGGHVAYVEKVLPAHRITISTMGEDSRGGITTTIRFTQHKTFFIHHR